MADITVTATSVAKSSDTQFVDGFLGATVTAGQAVYLDSADGLYKLADANASASTAATIGVALNGGASGQPVKVAIGGTYNPGATVVVGTIYVTSATAGGIAPAADLVSGWFTTILGVGITASSLRLVPHRSGVAVP